MSHALSGTHNLPVTRSKIVAICVGEEMRSMGHALSGTHNLPIICSKIVVIHVREEVKPMNHGAKPCKISIKAIAGERISAC